MAKIQHRARQLAQRAIEETGSTDPGVVSLKIEDYVRSNMGGWKVPQETKIWWQLERYGLKKYSDVVGLVNQLRGEAT